MVADIGGYSGQCDRRQGKLPWQCDSRHERLQCNMNADFKGTLKQTKKTKQQKQDK